MSSYINTRYMVGSPDSASMWRGVEVTSLQHCWAVCLYVFNILLLTPPHKFCVGFRSGEWAVPVKQTNNTVSKPFFGEAGSSADGTTKGSEISSWQLCWLWTWKNAADQPAPTPADDAAPRIVTDCGNVRLDFKHFGFCASPLFLYTPGTWFSNKTIWKEAIEQQPSTCSPQPK